MRVPLFLVLRLVLGLIAASLGSVAAQEVESTPPMGTVTPVLTPEGDVALAGSNGITASVVQMEQSISQTIEALYKQAGGSSAREVNAFRYYLDQYERLGSTPYLYALGFNLDGLLGPDSLFMPMLWAAVLIFVAISISSQLHGASSSFMEYMSGLLMKLTAVTLILTFPEFIYATAMTVQASGEHVFSRLTQSAKTAEGGAASRMVEVLKGAGTHNIELATLRTQSIRRGLSERSGFFTRYVAQPEKDNVANDYLAVFFTQMSVAQSAAAANGRSYSPIPRTGEASPEDIKVKLLERYQALAMDSAAIPAERNIRTNFDLSWEYADYSPVVSTFSIRALSNAIATVTSEIEKALAKTNNTQQGQSARKELLEQYATAVSDATANWVDTEIIDGFVRTMEGNSRLMGWFTDLGTRATRTTLAATENLSVPSLLDKIANVFSSGVMAAQKFVVPVLGVIGSYCLRLLMELGLVGLMIASPFYFFEGTKRAFTGAIQTLISGALMLPFWHFFQTILDLLFVGISGVMLGAGATTGAVSLAMATSSLVSLGGGAMALMIGLAVAYIGASIFLLFKTPGMVRGFLAGGAWVTDLIGTAIKGGVSSALIAGAAMTAGAAASVGGVALAGGAAKAAGAAGAAQSIGAGSTVGAAATGGRMASFVKSMSSAGNGIAGAFKGGASMTKHLFLSNGDPLRAYMGAREEQQQRKKEAASVV